MLKPLLLILLIALPTIAYIGYIWLQSRRNDVGLTGQLARAPWHWLSLGGVGLAAASLGAWALMGDPAGGTYEPPRLENGQIVPGTHTPSAD